MERQQQQQLAWVAVLAWGQQRQEAQNRTVERCQAQMQQAQARAMRAEDQVAALNQQVPHSAGILASRVCGTGNRCIVGCCHQGGANTMAVAMSKAKLQ